MTGEVKYRSDIDGLRAIAVVPVVLYHLGVVGFSGGFVGVDIFFVISGYLITGNIHGELKAGDFTIVGFYERRIRRIFPALFFMLATVTAVAAALFMPVDFKSYAGSLAATALFGSNFFFFLKSGYFDQAAELKPLLHTWSLAVEEQYYVFFPPLMAFIVRRVGPWRAVLAALLAISFLISVVEVRLQPTGAFYMPWARMWELLIGALLAVNAAPRLHRRMAREGLAALGLALIVVAIALFNPATRFPGESALLPCGGAGLMIYANTGGATAVGRLVSNRLFVLVGLISYSLYLWHWPVLVFARYVLMRPFSPIEQALLFGLAVVLAILSWRFVERPFRRARGRPPARLFAGALAGIAAAVVVGAAGFEADGLPQRLPPAVRTLAQGADDVNPRRARCDAQSPRDILAGGACAVGGPGTLPPSFAVLGDSFGDAIVPGVDAAARQVGERGLVFTASGCYALVGLDQGDPRCPAHMQAALKIIDATPSISTVVIIGRWTTAATGVRFGAVQDEHMFITDSESRGESHEENLRVFERSVVRTVQALRPRRVIFLAYVPEQAVDVPRAAALRRYFERQPTIEVSRATHDARQQPVRQVLDALGRQMGFEVLDATPTLCDQTRCEALRNGRPLYYDDNHLSGAGAILLAPSIAKALQGSAVDKRQPVRGDHGGAAPVISAEAAGLSPASRMEVRPENLR